MTGDYLFDPHPGTRYNKDDDHIAQVIELMGPFPRSIALGGKFSSDIFTRKGEYPRCGSLIKQLILGISFLYITGELKHIQKLKFWPLHSVLMDKYLISEHEALRLESFLQPMLNLSPDKRATAQEMLSHEWFNGVVVQGEIEVYERSEGTGEAEREKIEIGKATAQAIGGMDSESLGVRNASIIDPQLVNALKPVDYMLEKEISVKTAASPKITLQAA